MWRRVKIYNGASFTLKLRDLIPLISTLIPVTNDVLFFLDLLCWFSSCQQNCNIQVRKEPFCFPCMWKNDLLNATNIIPLFSIWWFGGCCGWFFPGSWSSRQEGSWICLTFVSQSQLCTVPSWPMRVLTFCGTHFINLP